MTWRDEVDKSIKNHLELQIKEASNYSSAYKKAKNPSNAQLWIAIANLSKQIFDLSLKVKFFEKALRDITTSKLKDTGLKKQSGDIKELKKSLKRM